jgi:hypothetical protein
MATIKSTLFLLVLVALMAVLALAVLLNAHPEAMPQITVHVRPMSDAQVQAIAHADVALAPSEHAVIRHGASAWAAIQACNNGPEQLMTRTNPANGRKMTICMKAGRGYVVVDDAEGNNITAYPKDELRFWDELVRYLRFSGYTRW